MSLIKWRSCRYYQSFQKRMKKFLFCKDLKEKKNSKVSRIRTTNESKLASSCLYQFSYRQNFDVLVRSSRKSVLKHLGKISRVGSLSSHKNPHIQENNGSFDKEKMWGDLETWNTDKAKVVPNASSKTKPDRMRKTLCKACGIEPVSFNKTGEGREVEPLMHIAGSS